jgi:lactoylglutathione lyase
VAALSASRRLTSAVSTRLTAIGGIDLDPEPMQPSGAPLMFMVRDPDGNHIVVVERPADA